MGVVCLAGQIKHKPSAGNSEVLDCFANHLGIIDACSVNQMQIFFSSYAFKYPNLARN